MRSCRKRPEPCASAAISRLAAVIAETSASSGRARLATANRLVNAAIRRTSNLVAFGEADHWAAPIETFTVGQGDCEEFAIAKYAVLSEASWPLSDLRLVILFDKATREQHMVAAARLEGLWLVLDNRSNILAEDRELTRFVPQFVLDQRGVLRIREPSPSAAPKISGLCASSAS